MTNRIDAIFQARRAEKRGTLMPFVCGGYPRPGMTGDVLLALQDAGASIVEVGIPFSDPIADGPVIAAAMHEALTHGATPATVLDEVRAVRDRLTIGLVAMVSASIAFRSGGHAEFARQLAGAGFDGVIFPDAPLEEADPFLKAAASEGLVASLLVAPTAPLRRAQDVACACTGFVYVLARAGITGERENVPNLGPRIAQVREVTQLPIAVGFGISSAAHVRTVVSMADAAIVGSALVRRMSEAGPDGAVGVARTFCAELATGLS